MHKNSKKTTKPNGYFLGIGATKSLAEKEQLEANCKSYKTKPTLKKLLFSFRLQLRVHQSQETFNARLKIPNGSFLEIKTAEVRIDIPFILVLEDLLEYCLLLDFQYNSVKTPQNMKNPYRNKNGYSIINPKLNIKNCYFKRAELLIIITLCMSNQENY